MSSVIYLQNNLKNDKRSVNYERFKSYQSARSQSRLRERMKISGATYKQRQSITKIDVISKDEKLKLIFDGIVRKYQAKYIGG